MSENNKNYRNNSGIVYLIGAGPGDPGLITLRGRDLLLKCDVVVYDNLIPDELIILLPEKIEKHYVGKSEGKHTLPQEDINNLLVKLASDGKNVARLKGGDPFIFGRGSEEARYLRENNIRFEIIPGITAGVAAPAYNGIPCTDREQSSYVLFVTGHKAVEKEFSSVPWDWVSRAKNGTLVIYMGVSELPEITQKLLDGGMPPDIEACVIERGTTPSQKIVSSTLSELHEKVRNAGIKPPSLIVIGKVVGNEPLMSWQKTKPLYGLRIMVTRPADQSEYLYSSIRELGGEVLPYPTIATSEYIDEKGYQKFEESLTDDSNKKWLIFTGENGVRYFFSQYFSGQHDIRKLARFRIAVMGEGTVEALKALNISADYIPTESTTDTFIKEFSDRSDIKDTTIVRIRGDLAESRIEDSLESIECRVIPITAYKTFVPGWPDNMKERLFKYPPDIIIFTSVSTVDGFNKILTKDDVSKLTANAKILSMGPSASKALEKSGIPATIEAESHTISGIIECLKEHYSPNK